MKKNFLSLASVLLYLFLLSSDRFVIVYVQKDSFLPLLLSDKMAVARLKTSRNYSKDKEERKGGAGGKKEAKTSEQMWDVERIVKCEKRDGVVSLLAPLCPFQGVYIHPILVAQPPPETRERKAAEA